MTEQIPRILIIRQKEGDESVTILSIRFVVIVSGLAQGSVSLIVFGFVFSLNLF